MRKTVDKIFSISIIILVLPLTGLVYTRYKLKLIFVYWHTVRLEYFKRRETIERFESLLSRKMLHDLNRNVGLDLIFGIALYALLIRIMIYFI